MKPIYIYIYIYIYNISCQCLRGPTYIQLYLPSFAKSGVRAVKLPISVPRKHPKYCAPLIICTHIRFSSFLSAIRACSLSYPLSLFSVSTILLSRFVTSPEAPDVLLSTHLGLPLLDRLRRMRTGVPVRRSTY